MRVIFDLVRDGLSAIDAAANEMTAARQQVATGKRLSSVSDDPLAAQQAIGEHATLGAIDAYSQTRDSAAARLAATDSALNGIIDKISSAVVAATSARSSTVDPAARAAASAEVRGLQQSLLNDFNTTFNGSYIFSGTQAGTAAFANIGGVWTYQGDSAAVQLEVERNRLISVSFDGQSIAQGTDASDVFTTLQNLANAIDAGDTAGIASGIDALNNAFDRANRALGRLGADERTVDDAAQHLSALRTAADSRRSHLEDANMAEAITRMTTAENAYKAALSAVSTAERESLLDYLNK
jgi:flagellar hook-associated protein 3 FlgL